ncbi:hypothetical protein Gohar_004586 [Gossypium harknessii]|uniref:DUF4283 domain-containing protein n=1 Tax=Gossypium harknessii TaxID=34285 RepID=A0A7J9H5B0_9ROSI|nr:hypothetical protein [Gossypium harknessii]
MEADLAALSLDGGEEDAWSITSCKGEEEGGNDLYFVGSFLTANIIQLQAMRTTVANLWHPYVMDGNPWTFNNHLLVYHRLQLGEDPLRVPLHFVDYWIQVHDLSPGLMSEGMKKQFGAFLGTYIDYDAKPISIGVVIFARGDKEGFAEACQNAIGKYQLAGKLSLLEIGRCGMYYVCVLSQCCMCEHGHGQGKNTHLVCEPSARLSVTCENMERSIICDASSRRALLQIGLVDHGLTLQENTCSM